MDPAHIRNFSIIAHIDHGKSTLADRLLEVTGALSQREMMAQVLDTMDLERERGITIKAHAVRLHYRAKDGQDYQLNLIDTPGHVDFTYEVSRSLQACEGALLVVDASQGVEAQTLANTYLALHHNLEIIPVINKIDLPSAEPDRVREQIEHVIGLDASGAILASAKNGIGIGDILEAIVHLVPQPKGSPDDPLRALIFDSWFDPYRGVIILTRVFSGRLRVGQKIRLWSNNSVHEVEGGGGDTSRPSRIPCEELSAGEVGFLFANIKTVSDAQIGDTIIDHSNPASEPLPGFEPLKPMVFAGLYPVESHEHGLRPAGARGQFLTIDEQRAAGIDRQRAIAPVSPHHCDRLRTHDGHIRQEVLPPHRGLDQPAAAFPRPAKPRGAAWHQCPPSPPPRRMPARRSPRSGRYPIRRAAAARSGKPVLDIAHLIRSWLARRQHAFRREQIFQEQRRIRQFDALIRKNLRDPADQRVRVLGRQ